MSILKRFLAGLAVVAMMSSSLTVFALSNTTFTDVSDSDENAPAINYLKDAGVVQGYEDGSYKPYSTINRAEFLKILMEAAALQTGGSNCFKDVKDGWFAPYVCKASELGLVKGYEDGNFRPAQEISFAEASKIVVNTLEIQVEASDGTVWYEGFVKTLEKLDAIPKSIGSFGQYVTRGEMAEIIWRIKEAPQKASLSYLGVKRREAAAQSGGALSTFDSCVDLEDYLHENTQMDYYGYGDDVMYKSASPTAVGDSAAESSAEEAPAADGLGSGADNYSETNVQVEGVDEADIVKTDGKYIYVVKGDLLKIVKAYPPEDLEVVSTVEFADKQLYPEQIYVDGDRLVVIQTGYNYDYLISPFELQSGIVPNLDGNLTHVSVYDISDPSDPKVVREVSVEGSHESSRKVDDTVYLVTSQYNYYYGIEEDPVPTPLPLLGDSKTGKIAPAVGCSDVWYVPGSTGTSYTTVSAIPVNDLNAKVDAEVVMGSNGQVYASRENLYLAEYGNDWWWGWDASPNTERTVLHKFALNGNNVQYKGKGEVPGTILNQFSMDEYNGYFRIATTTGNIWDSTNPSKNNVYILDSGLNTVGKIEGIAPGEKIYSVRFMGKRLYMVTFKKVDPFFVIDVADPKAPKILGKLKIPGYSDYLHPFDENHVIGFGKDALDASEDEVDSRDLDFAWYQGIKVAMFDVTDVSNPVEMDKVIIGDRGTDSALLWDHKALLFDKKHSLIAFPVTLAEIPEDVKNDPNTPDYTYGDYTFQGAYVYGVSLTGGFEYKGRISHYDPSEVADLSGYYWYGESDISRILYMNDYLYTVSMALIRANKVSDLSQVNEVELN